MTWEQAIPGEPVLRAAWQATSDALALSGPDGTLLAANAAYFELYGYPPEEVLGKSFAVIFPEAERAQAEALYREVFEGPADAPAFESEVLRRDGTQRVVESRVEFIEQDGRRVAMLSVVRDVTAEVEARRAAEQAERARQDLLSSLSHDIKSPLSVIRGQAQLLRRGATRSADPASSDRLVAGLAQIEASVVQLSGLVDELVEVSGSTEGSTPPLNLALVDMVDIVREAVERHQRVADEHCLTLQAGVDSAVGYWDAARIQRVLDNLIGNAIKYSPEGGTVLVSVTSASRAVPSASGGPDRAMAAGVLLGVEDQGIGIRSADLPHVFERFRRGENVQDTVPGSGIGLSSVHEIVKQHGGTIEIDSQEGAGTQVSVWLPLEPLTPPADEAG